MHTKNMFVRHLRVFRKRDRLEDLLRTITTDRSQIGELMLFCIDHAEYSEEVIAANHFLSFFG